VTVDEIYVNLIKDILDNGQTIQTRNSKVKRKCGLTVRFDTTPLVSVRKTPWKSAIAEFEWFLSGSNYVPDLPESVQKWWSPWADPETEKVNYNYSQQFRTYAGNKDGYFVYFDQIEALINGIIRHPYSRRNCITTWNPPEMWSKSCPITNCHNSFTSVITDEDGRLSLYTTQRSSDVIVGLPANWIQMAAFQLWLCSKVSRPVGEFVWHGIDCHVYDIHTDLARLMIDRVGECEETPILQYISNNEDFKASDFSLIGEYKPVILEKAEMVV
jgi:thymidylate synthase